MIVIASDRQFHSRRRLAKKEVDERVERQRAPSCLVRSRRGKAERQ